MKGDDLPEHNHFVRYAGPMRVVDACAGTVDGTLFTRSRNKPQDNPSANWLEAFRGDREAQLNQIRGLARISLKQDGRYAECEVGEVVRAAGKHAPDIQVLKDPLNAEDGYEADPSHAEIVGLPDPTSPKAALVGDLIAKCVIRLYPAAPN